VVNKKILITGGSGYIGSRLSLYLSQKGFDIIPLCNSKIPDNKEWIQSMHCVLQGDLRDRTILKNIETIKPDSIIHLASLDHYNSGRDIQETLQVNVKSTWDLLSIGASNGLRKFIYFSTTQVYGFKQQMEICEKVMPEPGNAYGLTHLMSEEIVSLYSRTHKIDGVSLRLSNSYGEPLFDSSKHWELVVNDLCRSAFFDQRIVLNSNGNASRDFIHYTSITDCVFKLLVKKRLKFGNYNLCSNISITLLELALVIQSVYKKKFGFSIDIYINGSELYKLSIPSALLVNSRISNQKLWSETNFKILNLESGVEMIFNSFR
jgi:UDP-glucose 4-epimerase